MPPSDASRPRSGRFQDLLRRLEQDQGETIGFAHITDVKEPHPQLLILVSLRERRPETLEVFAEAGAHVLIVTVTARENLADPLPILGTPVLAWLRFAKPVAPSDVEAALTAGFDGVVVSPGEARAACFATRQRRISIAVSLAGPLDQLRGLSALGPVAIFAEDSPSGGDDVALTGDVLARVAAISQMTMMPAILVSRRVQPEDLESLVSVRTAGVALPVDQAEEARQYVAGLDAAARSLDPHVRRAAAAALEAAAVVLPLKGLQEQL